jgi:hypothetical protein
MPLVCNMGNKTVTFSAVRKSLAGHTDLASAILFAVKPHISAGLAEATRKPLILEDDAKALD